MTGSEQTADGDLRRGLGSLTGFVYARQETADLARQTREWLREDYGELARRLIDQNANRTPQQRAGAYFEFWESVKFNVDAAGMDSHLTARTTAADGRTADPADIEIVSGNEVLQRVQAKVYDDDVGAIQALGQDRYEGLQRLVPSDQEPGLRSLLRQRLDQNPDGRYVSRYEDIDAELGSELAHGGVSSGGTTRDELQTLAEGPRNALLDALEQRAWDAELQELLAMTGTAAIAGGAFGLVAASIQAAIQRESSIPPTRQIVEIARTAGTTAVRSGTVGGFAHVIRAAARRSDQLIGFSESLGPVAIASAAVEVAAAGYAFATGQCTAQEFSRRSSAAAMRNTTMWAFGFVGQTLIPVPVAGQLIGGAVGYATAALLQEGLKIATVAAKEAKAAQQELRTLELWIYDAIACIEEERRIVELTTELHSRHLANRVLPLLDTIEHQLATPSDAHAFASLVEFNARLGLELAWTTPAEFDQWMLTNEPLVL